MEELFKEYKVISTAKVQWGDMDAMQHVNNTVYVKWGEMARIDYFTALGVFSPKQTKIKFAPILAFQSVKYIVPVVYPDTIHIGTKIEEIKADRIVLKSFYYSEKWGKLLAIKTQEVIPFDYQTQIRVPVSNELILQINNMEGL